MLVVATVPATALLRDPAHAGDYLLRDPKAATVRLETFDARPYITSVSECQMFARRMREAQATEDQYGAVRLGLADGKPKQPKRPRPAKLDPGTPLGLGTRPNLGKPLA